MFGKQEKIFESKFDYIKDKFSKQKSEEIRYLDNRERMIQEKFNGYLRILKEKVFNQCAKNINELDLYLESSNKSSLNDLDTDSIAEYCKTVKTKPGTERDFKTSINNLKTCSKNYGEIKRDLYKKMKIMSEISRNSNSICILKCKDEIREKLSESLAINCLDSCLTYHKINVDNSYNQISFLLDNSLDKIF
jgi:hypothetical protein